MSICARSQSEQRTLKLEVRRLVNPDGHRRPSTVACLRRVRVGDGLGGFLSASVAVDASRDVGFIAEPVGVVVCSFERLKVVEGARIQVPGNAVGYSGVQCRFGDGTTASSLVVESLGRDLAPSSDSSDFQQSNDLGGGYAIAVIRVAETSRMAMGAESRRLLQVEPGDMGLDQLFSPIAKEVGDTPDPERQKW